MTFDRGKYQREKYWNDPEYHKNRIAWSKEWSKKNQKRIRIAQKRRYDNRTPTQIIARKKYLKELRSKT